jgi:hypothetical protein
MRAQALPTVLLALAIVALAAFNLMLEAQVRALSQPTTTAIELPVHVDLAEDPAEHDGEPAV